MLLEHAERCTLEVLEPARPASAGLVALRCSGWRGACGLAWGVQSPHRTCPGPPHALPAICEHDTPLAPQASTLRRARQ